MLKYSRLCLKFGGMTNCERFFAEQGVLTRGYLVHFKKKQNSRAEKTSPFRRADMFQERLGGDRIPAADNPLRVSI